MVFPCRLMSPRYPYATQQILEQHSLCGTSRWFSWVSVEAMILFALMFHHFILVQSFSHVRLCDPVDCSTPGFPGHHQLPEFIHTHVHSVGDAIRTSHSSVGPFFFHFQSFPASGSFQMSQFFPSGSQSIRISASASVLPKNIQDLFPLGLTG